MQASRSFSRRVLHLDARTWTCYGDEPADATGYPLPTPVLRQANT